MNKLQWYLYVIAFVIIALIAGANQHCAKSSKAESVPLPAFHHNIILGPCKFYGWYEDSMSYRFAHCYNGVVKSTTMTHTEWVVITGVLARLKEE